MLIRFAVENYKSFKKRQLFSMVAGKNARHPFHCLDYGKVNILKGSFFFGANAAGKSNFVRALDFMRRVTLYGTDAMFNTDRFFRIDPDYRQKPGVFQADFITEQKVYSYGFAIDYLTHKIKEEWLYRIEPSGTEVCVFERENFRHISTGLNLSEQSHTRFKIYCEDLNGEELFLRSVGKKHLSADSEFSDYIDAYKWFEKVIVVYPNSHPKSRNAILFDLSCSSDYMSGIFQDFDTGVEGIKKGKVPAEDAFSFLPEEEKKNLLNDIEQNIRKNTNKCSHFRVEAGDYQFELSLENDELIAERIMLDHGNSSDLFDFIDESDGTKRLFDLIPLYEIGKKERIIIIDELDRSFHSKLTEEYIKRFFEITCSKPSQLICTTHDLNLMDLRILRQDEIWFVERQSDHSSRIYSLNDYKHRYDKNVLDSYLIGRYGAIPCFQNNVFSEDAE